MSSTSVLGQAARHAIDYLQGLDDQAIKATASLAALRECLDRPLSDEGVAAERVIDDLVADTAGGLLGSGSGRFYGWVIGGNLPVALAADWLTSAWDQNAASNVTAPAEAVVEEIGGDWLKQLLGLPGSASFAFVTGCQMAHTTAFAAARHHLLRQRGWDVEAKGLQGAPEISILTSENRHESILRAIRLLGLGTDAVISVASDGVGRMDPGALDNALCGLRDRAVIVSLQAGDLNTGVFDSFKSLCPIARKHEAWAHVDGAFGLWASVSPHYKHLLEGVEQANSWATDGHKWLNLPFDSGFVFVAEPAAHRAAFSQATSYAVPLEDLRNQKDWNPEWSRRGRGFAVYAALRHLGRNGLRDLIERCCRHAARLVEGIAALDGAEALARPVINQGLVRFLSPDGDHDRRTDEVIAALQDSGDVWFGGVTWRGKRAMRISVCNWLTSDEDIERTLQVVRRVLSVAPAASR